MKKTIIALMALAGVASAVTLTEKDITGYVHVEGTSFSEWTTNFTITEEADGDYKFSGAPIATEYPDSDKRSVTTVAITLDASKLSTVAANSPLLILDGTTDIGIGFTADRKASTIWGTNYSYFAVNSVLPTTGDVTLTLSFGNDGTSLYVGAAYDTHSALKGAVGEIDTMILSSYAVDAMKSITTYAGVASLRDTSLASSAIALNAAKAIPEPTTATLSLLALAGLAARRRRK